MTDINPYNKLTRPTIWDEGSDIGRLNAMLDNATVKKFVNPGLFVATVRAILNFNGITLPHLPIEGEGGADPRDGLAIQSAPSVISATNSNITAPPTEAEYFFKLADADAPDYDYDDDWDDFLYLYMIIDRDDELGVWEAYAQIIDKDELDLLSNLEDHVSDVDYPDMNDSDVAGETPYLRQVRHTFDDQ
ncbi:MAG: hypothetical protein ACRDFB_10655 [Rhabdochlamydiaceae bacterium]